jgi:type 1 fimbria pilin
MMKRIIPVVLSSALLFSPYLFASLPQGGTITFRGSIVNPVCNIENNPAAKSVNLQCVDNSRKVQQTFAINDTTWRPTLSPLVKTISYRKTAENMYLVTVDYN